jgi:hypothetical protein
VKKLELTKMGWKSKYAIKEGELDALKVGGCSYLLAIRLMGNTVAEYRPNTTSFLFESRFHQLRSYTIPLSE